MSSNPRKTKGGDHKLNISLNEEQKLAKAEILSNKITILKGPAGCGKTQLAVAVALDQLLKKEVDKIIITRPLVTSGEELGFLPGDIHGKTLPFLLPIYECMYNCLDKQLVDSYIADGTIQISPISFVRGRTYNALAIIDESQNLTSKQMEDVLTRLGSRGKLIFCGDMNQCDLKNKKDSGFPFLKNLEGKVKGVKFVELKVNHRDPIVEEIIKIYNEFRD